MPGARPAAPDGRYTTWSAYEGDPGAAHYSALRQIDRANVHRLEIAWTYPIGDVGNARMPFNPLIVDSIMYVMGRGFSVVALHAGTGRELWVHHPSVPEEPERGFTYWENEDRSDRRIFLAPENRLYAIDALTGRRIESFGENGSVDLREGLGRDPNTLFRVWSRTPGRAFENLIIFGSATGEGYDASPGHVRAFDARTGEQVWIFHTIPHPGEYGYETWPPDAWKRVGGANVWAGLSLDEQRGIVYLPIGSATYDFYGADRIGQNLFANSLVALDARTGKRLWHQQLVHHDLWDYDLSATPALLTVRHEGRMRDVVAVATKQGFVFVFDRVTGEPLWPIEERPVPRTDMVGEESWPTQPFPTRPPPFVEQMFTEADVNPYLTPAERDSVLEVLRGARNEGLFTPGSERGTIQMPGTGGGANWGSTAADPSRGRFYVLGRNMAVLLKLEPVVEINAPADLPPLDLGHYLFRASCAQCHGTDLQGQPPMVPSLVGITERRTADEIRDVVRNGRGPMPPFRGLSDRELHGILAYLREPEKAKPLDLDTLPADESAGQRPLRYMTGQRYMFVSGRMMANRPPWSTLTAYDLNRGTIEWQVPVGDLPSLVAKGIRGTGRPGLRGGPAVTAGGLVFLITGPELEAFDADTGMRLWGGELPMPGEGIPAIYEVDGRQFVAVSAAGIASASDGDGEAARRPAYVAFALPERPGS